MDKLGVWLIGARGSVATTAIVGAAAIRAGAASPRGCVSESAGLCTMVASSTPQLAASKPPRVLKSVATALARATPPIRL